MNRSKLIEVKIRHLEWMLAIQDLLEQKRVVPDDLLSFQFNEVIGEWFLAKSILDEGLRGIVNEILDIHSEIHETVNSIQHLTMMDHYAEANGLYDELRNLSAGFIFSLNLLHNKQSDWLKFIQAA